METGVEVASSLNPVVSVVEGAEGKTSTGRKMRWWERIVAVGGVAIGAAGAAGKLVGNVNKINHIFGQAKHKLGPVIAALGSAEEAARQLQAAVDAAIRRANIAGVFEIQVSIGGHWVTVRGLVTGGQANIGSAWIP